MVKFVNLGLVLASLLSCTRSWRINSILKDSINSYRFQRLNSHSHFSSPSSTKEVTNKSLSGFIKFSLANFLFYQTSKVVFADESVVDAIKAPVVPVSDLFTETESGLKYRDTKVGSGEIPIPGDTVRVHYTGWLDDFESEKKFDSSYDRRSPLVFKVGVKQVIAGWDEALLTNMKVGGKREIIIPASLGYGQRGAGGVIPPNATLYFKIELVGIGAKANK